MKKFSIPGYFHYFEECKALLALYKEHPEYFYDDRTIDSSYDLPSGLIWNGGRVKPFTGYSSQELYDKLNYYFENTDISLHHTCTNCCITYEMTLDWQCNIFLEHYYREKDYIIINSKLLHTALAKTYPKNHFIYSATLNIDDFNLTNKLSDDNIVVLNYKYNNDDFYLKGLAHPQNIEIICAEPCVYDCPNRLTHYQNISECQLDISTKTSEELACPYHMEDISFSEIQTLPHAITNERIDELYNLGYQYFKISGRTLPVPQWIQTITYYLIKPEWLDYVRFELLNQLW